LQLTSLEVIGSELIGFGVKDICSNLNVVTLRYFNRNNAWAVNYFVSSYFVALIISIVETIAVMIFLAKKGTVAW